MNRIMVIIIFSIIWGNILKSQSITQNIRGNIVDKYTKVPMEAVNVILLGSGSKVGVSSDRKGNFEIKGVKIGRTNILFSFIGYKDVILKNIYVNSAKELILNVEMEEDVSFLEDVVLEKSKKELQIEKLNELTAVSSNYLAFEDAYKFAGNFNDPGRMVHNFAGVSQSSDERNDIIIRGNNPLGVVWQLNGLMVHSPNHFSGMGTAGGSIPMLNTNLLDYTNFLTGAFPSNFFNGTAGVFDIETRNGNDDKFEIVSQVGFTGLELGVEGPIQKKRSSYVANYRYSFLLLLIEMGLDIGYAEIPQYQDLNFKINLVSDDYGKFEIFGLGGFSNLIFPKDTVSLTADISDFNSSLGVLGIKNTYFFNDKTRQESHFGISGKHNLVNIYRKPSKHYVKDTEVDSYEVKFMFKYGLFRKINSKNFIDLGTNLDWMLFKYDQTNIANTLNLETGLKQTQMISAFANYRNKSLENITFNMGFNFQYFTLNKKSSYEPRLSIRYDLSKNQDLSLAFGNHSQSLPIVYYYIKDNQDKLNNLNLDFIRANHITLGYKYNFLLNWSLKVETYYQYLYGIPVESISSGYSFINTGAEYVIIPKQKLESKGSGENYGVEFTLEKTISTDLGLNYYFMTTLSLYESKYMGSDKKYRNTKWNENYILNSIAGFEFRLDNAKRHLLGFNLRVNLRGNRRYEDIDINASNQYYQLYYQNRLPYYFRLDFKLSYKLNLINYTHEIVLDIQNILNRKNISDRRYYFDNQNQKIESIKYNIGIVPTFNYRLYL